MIALIKKGVLDETEKRKKMQMGENSINVSSFSDI